MLCSFSRITRSIRFSATTNRQVNSNSSRLVDYSIDSAGIAVIKLNTPSNLNALTVDMGEAFENVTKELSILDSKSLRCVVLTGAGL